MTDSARPVCNCPEPCACYAEGYAVGKNKAYFEVLANQRARPTPRAAHVSPVRSRPPVYGRSCR